MAKGSLEPGKRLSLSGALRLGDGDSVAFTGAGGKTTAIFTLAGEIQKPVLVTTTTHLGVDQVKWADHHYILQNESDIGDLETSQLVGVTLITASIHDEGRYAGLSEDVIARLHALSRRTNMALLIEADGSRMLPLKAPAAHEPVIPSFVDTTVVVAGLSGLEQPLNDMWVHRPEKFASLAGIQAGEQISSAALVNVLMHSSGGLKGIPGRARRVVLLNQADTPALQSVAQRMAQDLKQKYSAVLVASLLPGGKSRATPGVYAVYEPIGAIVLAAGASKRFGKPKQLLDWQGEPLVRRVARIALQAGLRPVIVVTGARHDHVSAALEGLTVEVAYNPDWQQGQSASVRRGLEAMSSDVGGAVFMLADQPLIPPELVRSLVAAHAGRLAPVVAPLVDGKRGNPVLFDRVTFPALRALEGDKGGRGIFSQFQVEWQPWHDARPLMDIDTPADYRRLLDI